ncbi:MAG TPA: hypothetical protein VMV57_04080 [Terracidiphilus sp.]|nr:hypothetical protein [Terracidiphilus sp.]
MTYGIHILLATTVLASASAPARPQSPSAAKDPATQLNEYGHRMDAGRAVPFVIRRLPVNSFPGLPSEIAEELAGRGCLIPQTYEAHRPENVIHASLERAGSSDWAVLCSAQGRVSLLVFFGSDPWKPMELASAMETGRVQAHGTSSVLGFNWGIDPATPDQVHDAQSGMDPRPPALDHDALADSVIDRSTVYHYFSKGAWSLLELPQ